MTDATDPGLIGSLTTIHLLLILALAIGVIAVMVIAARNRARGKRQVRHAEQQREEAGQLPPSEDALVATMPVERVAAPTAPPPPPLADTPVVATAPAATAPVSEVLAQEPPTQATGEDSGAGDVMTRMKGVGPKLAVRLNELGYTRFDQLAALTPDELAALDAQLGSFQGRLARDRVVEQAGYLARGDTAGFEQVFGKLG